MVNGKVLHVIAGLCRHRLYYLWGYEVFGSLEKAGAVALRNVHPVCSVNSEVVIVKRCAIVSDVDLFLNVHAVLGSINLVKGFAVKPVGEKALLEFCAVRVVKSYL